MKFNILFALLVIICAAFTGPVDCDMMFTDPNAPGDANAADDPSATDLAATGEEGDPLWVLRSKAVLIAEQRRRSSKQTSTFNSIAD